MGACPLSRSMLATAWSLVSSPHLQMHPSLQACLLISSSPNVKHVHTFASVVPPITVPSSQQLWIIDQEICQVLWKPSLTLSWMTSFFSVLPLSPGLLEQSSDYNTNMYFVFLNFLKSFLLCRSLIWKVRDCIFL